MGPGLAAVHVKLAPPPQLKEISKNSYKFMFMPLWHPTIISPRRAASRFLEFCHTFRRTPRCGAENLHNSRYFVQIDSTRPVTAIQRVNSQRLKATCSSNGVDDVDVMDCFAYRFGTCHTSASVHVIRILPPRNTLESLGPFGRMSFHRTFCPLMYAFKAQPLSSSSLFKSLSTNSKRQNLSLCPQTTFRWNDPNPRPMIHWPPTKHQPQEVAAPS